MNNHNEDSFQRFEVLRLINLMLTLILRHTYLIIYLIKQALIKVRAHLYICTCFFCSCICTIDFLLPLPYMAKLKENQLSRHLSDTVPSKGTKHTTL